MTPQRLICSRNGGNLFHDSEISLATARTLVTLPLNGGIGDLSLNTSPGNMSRPRL
jgi:hypothetical protein